MAIYHCSIKIIKRSQGRSAVAAVAYRSGQKLTNEWDGITHDYMKKGGVVHSEIILPAHAPPEFSDRSILWNSVEKSEKSRNAQLAREIEIALPAEIDQYSQIRLVRKYVQDIFVSVGMCADFSIHDKGDGNPHAHIMLTLRPLNKRGEWGAKCRKEYDLNARGQRIRLPGRVIGSTSPTGTIRARPKNGARSGRATPTPCWNFAICCSASITAAISGRAYRKFPPFIWASRPRRWSAGALSPRKALSTGKLPHRTGF
ncbi:conserved hypothetical protein [Scardovia inopinata JCM 12537]|nr:conserved hypothetical protein [Scardovia inopinata JCM 12537]